MPKLEFLNGLTSNIIRVFIPDTTSVIGAGKTGLTFSSAGLIIATIADNEASAVAYTQAGSTIETISTLGTYAAPTATKCRFKEVDSTNFPGMYEIQFANARFAVASARALAISLPPVTGLGTGPVRAEIQLDAVNNQDATRFGLTALPNAAANAAGGLAGNVMFGGTASAGGSNTITLAGGSAVDNLYKYSLVQIISGTGAGQSRLIIDYNGTTKVATISKTWATSPDNTSVFAIVPFATPEIAQSGLAQAGAVNTLTLSATASAVDNTYVGQVVVIMGGTGVGQSRIIQSYVGSTKVATLDQVWATTPDNTSVYLVMSFGRSWADVFQQNGLGTMA